MPKGISNKLKTSVQAQYRRVILAFACAASIAGQQALHSHASPDVRPYLTAESAAAGLDACQAVAAENSWNMAIAVFDRAGRIVAFKRMDDVFQKQIEVAMLKAETAATTPLSSKRLGDLVFAEDSALAGIEHAPGLMLIEGGEPILFFDQAIGGVGVSGSSPENDGTCARAAASAIIAVLERPHERGQK